MPQSMWTWHQCSSSTSETSQKQCFYLTLDKSVMGLLGKKTKLGSLSWIAGLDHKSVNVTCNCMEMIRCHLPESKTPSWKLNPHPGSSNRKTNTKKQLFIWCNWIECFKRNSTLFIYLFIFYPKQIIVPKTWQQTFYKSRKKYVNNENNYCYTRTEQMTC